MKLASTIMAALAAAALLGEGPELTKDERRYVRTGGEIVKRGTYTGKVLFANAQSRLPASDVQGVRDRIAGELNVRIECVETAERDPAKLLRDNGANVVLVVVDDPAAPTMLVAPEDRWAVVNTAKLVDDLPGGNAKRKFFVPRARKELIKAFSLLCGGGASQFPGNIMNTAAVRELDLVKEQIPIDMVDFWTRYLGSVGVTPKETTTYKQACREGWAPSPTNDVQKAIWEKAQAEKERGPANPITIQPPKKK